MGQPTDWKARLVKMGESFPPPPTPLQFLQWHPVLSRYPEFCWRLVTRFPERHFVFFERDALPLGWAMEEMLGASAEGRFHTLFLTRKMLPQTLRATLNAVDAPTVAEIFAQRSAEIVRYRPARKKNKAVRFVQQELEKVPSGTVLVDVSYWGTIPLFVQATMPRKHFEVAWVIGPTGSPALIKTTNGENDAVTSDEFFRFEYEADTLREEDGVLRPLLTSLGTHNRERHEANKSAFREFTRKWLAAREQQQANADEAK